jgi:BASS family bile acid:Na+ symporter
MTSHESASRCDCAAKSTAYTAKDYKSELKPIWCPGCGDFSVAAALYRALAAIGRPPHEIALISGIGCSSRLPGYTTAYGFNSLHGRAAEWPGRLRSVSFGLWVTAIFLITADASNFLHTQSGASHPVLFKIATLTFLICAVNFALGRAIGGRGLARECSQSLGQKNTTFTIFLALTYGSPLIALGPTCYVIWHNLWNAWQLHRAAQQKKG